MALDFEKIKVEDFLLELGINNVSDQGSDIRFSCPFTEGHSNGDANPSAYMQKGSTIWNCFGCSKSGNSVTFLADLENVSPLQAAMWIKERFNAGAHIPNQGNILETVKKQLNNKKKIETRQKFVLDEEEMTRRKLDWKSMEAWMKYSAGNAYGDPKDESIYYILNRGFSWETLNEWDIGWDQITERISIPIRNESGELVGFKGRSHNEEPRYIALGGIEHGFEPYETSRVLFALDRVFKTKNNEAIIVREGELNTIAMHSHGFHNTVGISGKNLSDYQAELIKKYTNKVIFYFDDEKDAIKAAKKLRRYIPTSIVPSSAKDPAELSRGEILSILDTQRSSLLK